MEWIFLIIVFVGGLIYEIIDRICECKEKRSKENKYKDFLL